MQTNQSLQVDTSLIVEMWREPVDQFKEIDNITDQMSKLKLEEHKEAKKIKAAKKQERKQAFTQKQTSNSSQHQPTNNQIFLREENAIIALRFSQDSVESKSSDGIDLFEIIRQQGWKQGSPIKVVEMPTLRVPLLIIAGC